MSEVLTLEELARYLKLSPDSIYHKAKNGEIPAVRIGKVWRFPKQLIDEWMREKAGTAKEAQGVYSAPAELDPEKDPIFKVIGIADVEHFADKIDEELYGE